MLSTHLDLFKYDILIESMPKISPEIKNAVIIEDDRAWQSRFNRILTEFGWVVVEQAATLDQALQLVHRLQDLQVRLVLLDGMLKNSFTITREEYEAQGGMIAREIRALYPEIYILGVSGVSIYQQDDPNVTDFAGKEHKTLSEKLSNIK